MDEPRLLFRRTNQDHLPYTFHDKADQSFTSSKLIQNSTFIRNRNIINIQFSLRFHNVKSITIVLCVLVKMNDHKRNNSTYKFIQTNNSI